MNTMLSTVENAKSILPTMSENVPKYFGYALAVLTLVLYAVFLTRPINLVNADIGRHITNGAVILQQEEGWKNVLHTNFYSYTHPEFEVINHHWGYGVLSAIVLNTFGWKGIHLLFVVMSVITLMIYLYLGKKLHSLWLASGLAIILLPFIVQRLEVRPEVLSYMLIGVFMIILLQKKWLWSLPLLQILWVNLHVYFPFGIFLIGIFGLPSFIRKDWKEFSTLLKVGLTTAVASCLSPFGIQGALYPFFIFGNYGYKIVENQSVMFLENWGMHIPSFMLLRVWSLLLLIGVIMIVIKKDVVKYPFILFGSVLCILAWSALRNFTLFGFVMIPVGALVLHAIWKRVEKNIEDEYRMIVPSMMLAICILFTWWMTYPQITQAFSQMHVGLYEGTDDIAAFIQDTELEGPIFNNYDNGGYLIFHLHPEHSVFVDNRPEAYPTSFFEDTYIPMQEDEEVWNQQLSEYDFNAIVFYYRDQTPWAQTFLQKRIIDENWVPVFADGQQLILVKNVDSNQEIIDQHAIDRSTFIWR